MHGQRVVFKLLALGTLLGLARLPASAQPRYEPNWDSLDKRPIPEWFLDAKFGIFIHWGVYSVPAWGAPKTYAEWYWHNLADRKAGNPWWRFHTNSYGADFDYRDFAPRFRAELFDARQWADLFHRSGAKYVVPTSKHHDGFCLWPSEEANRAWGRPWNSQSSGPRRDLMGELAQAVRAKPGMRFGFYYSLYEWYNPLWLQDRKRYVAEHLHPQFKDVVSRYRPALIFSDGEWELPSAEWKSPELLAWLYNESPCRDEVVVDDRWGKETRHRHGDYFTTEYGSGMKDAAHPWEENRGMGYSYGYNRAETIDDYKSARELILILCDLVSRGGNFLLDIGPTGDGRIPAIMQDRLVEIGKWLDTNGEAIYGTRHAGRDCQWSAGERPKADFKQEKDAYKLLDLVGQEPRGKRAVKQLFFTRKPGVLYAIAVGWPGKELVVRDIRVPPGSEVTLLGFRGPLLFRRTGKDLRVSLPLPAGDRWPGSPAYAFRITGAELLPEAP